MKAGWAGPAPPRREACCSSASVSCASRSISMMSGIPSTMKVVAAIQAALPVLLRSRLATYPASQAALLPFCTIELSEIRDKIPSSLLVDLLRGRLGAIDLGCVWAKASS